MTDQEISQALHSLLQYYSSSSSSQSSNPNSPAAPFTSITSVVQYLETKFGVDLSHKADFIRSQLQQFLFQPQGPPQQPTPPPLHHQQQHPHLQHHHQVHPYQQQQQHLHLQHHHQLQQQHPHLQIQTQQPSSFHPKDHYALQQSPNFHPGHSPSFFSSPFPPGGLSFQSVPTHHRVKSDPTILSNSGLPAGDPAKASGPSKGKRRGGAGGLNKLCGVSPELEAVVGHPALPRTEIVRQLWAYIRKNNLQDPSNKRKIICNDALRLVFETDCTDMFKMNKLLSKHILPLDPTKEASAKKQKVADEDKESSDVTQTVTQTISDSGVTQSISGVTQSVPDQLPASPTVALSPAPTSAAAPDLPQAPAPAQAPAPSVGISDELANFFGVGAREMLQSEVFTRVLDYINSNNLEDPVNPTVVVCDSKLEELFGCQSFPASKIMEVLSRQHIFRA